MKVTSTVLGVGVICMVVVINYRLTFGTANAFSEDSSSKKKTVVPKGEGREIPSSPKEKPSFFIQRMKVTAYCPCAKCCGKYSDGVTAIGRNAYKTVGVAADPTLIPYRTELEIPGLGKRIIDDTGGAMRQSAKKGIWHIDARFPSHQEALEWGVKWLNIKVYEK